MRGETFFIQSGIHSDVSPEIDHGRVLTVLGIVALCVIAYSFIVLQQILLGVFIVLAMGTVYLFFVFIQILDRIATALETMAEHRRE